MWSLKRAMPGVASYLCLKGKHTVHCESELGNMCTFRADYQGVNQDLGAKQKVKLFGKMHHLLSDSH